MISAVIPPTTPTGRFLLACLRPESQPEHTADVDWTACAELARRNGVAPLVYRRLSDVAIELPPAALEPLRRAYYQNAAANTLRYRELAQIMAVLDAEGIPAIVLKGPALALSVYPDPALRVIGDIDLLVRREYVARAMAGLQQLGYRTPDRELGYSIGYLTRFGRHLQLQRRDRAGTLELEIHWRLIGELWAGSVTAIDIAGLWARAIPLEGDGWRACQLSHADTLLHLALHATLMHAFTELGIRIYVDVDRLVRTYGVGAHAAAFWQEAVALARAQRLSAVLYTALKLNEDLLGTPLPPSLLASLSPGALQRRIFERSLRADDILSQTSVFTGQGKWRMRLMLLDRWRDGAQALWRIVIGGRALRAAYYRFYANR
jgi:hypothetical protein